MTPEEKEKRRVAWTPERREAQRQRTAQNGIEGPAARHGVIGTLAAIEPADRIESVAPNLRERYLLALLTRDAKIWRERQGKTERLDSGSGPAFAAFANTDKTCEGPPCKKCGGTLRYIKSRHCVACAKERAKPLHTRRAEVYLGRACPHCGGTERYKTDGKCVVCVKARNAKRRGGPKPASTLRSVPRLTQYRHVMA
jgi:hypothetical protein